MSFLTATTSELLYSMPKQGISLASTTKTVVSANSATNPAYQLPDLQRMPGWNISNMVGKALWFTAAGTFDTSASSNLNTLELWADITQNSTTGQILLAGTGAATWPTSVTVGAWHFEVLMTCVGVGTGATAATFYTTGVLKIGTANNAATTAVTTYMMGGANTLGVPNTVGINGQLGTGSGYFPEIWSTWTTNAPVAFACNEFAIYGLN